MANGNIIIELKNKVVLDIIKDKEIVQIIDNPDMEKDGWDPIYLNDSKITKDKGFVPSIYKYYKNPNLIEQECTFITIVVQIPNQYNNNKLFQNISLEINIVSHNEHMRIDSDVIQANRNDYLSILLDKKFNGIDIGICKLELISNVEGVYDENYNFRKLIFKTVDINDSIC